jgi:hypothetical protein
MRFLYVVGFGLVSVALASAQSAPVAHAPDGGVREFIQGLFVTPVPNAPFSGKLKGEFIRALEGGGTITHKFVNVAARDSRGRVLFENRQFIGDDGKSQPVQEFTILDPQAKTRTMCVIADKICRVARFRDVPMSNSATLPAGEFALGTRDMKRESLGSKTISGLEVVGTRETLTIKAGAAGNDRPIVSTKEFWYSPHLQVNLEIERTDPRTGKQTFRLTDLALGDPNANVFEIPPGYKVVRMERTTE